MATASDPSSVRATLSKRDNIGNDDRVTVYLDTFNDRRRAFFFGANPLGVQVDGVRTEGAVSAGNMFGGSVDLNPDFRYDTKGRTVKRIALEYCERCSILVRSSCSSGIFGLLLNFVVIRSLQVRNTIRSHVTTSGGRGGIAKDSVAG